MTSLRTVLTTDGTLATYEPELSSETFKDFIQLFISDDSAYLWTGPANLRMEREWIEGNELHSLSSILPFAPWSAGAYPREAQERWQSISSAGRLIAQKFSGFVG